MFLEKINRLRVIVVDKARVFGGALRFREARLGSLPTTTRSDAIEVP